MERQPQPSRWTRRRALGYAAAAAGTLAAGAVLDACGPSTVAAPTVHTTVLEVPVQLYIEGVSPGKTVNALIQQFLDRTFNAQTKGVRVVYTGGQGNMGGVVSQILGGSKTTPWIVASCCGDWPVIQPFLEKLDPYLQRDNVDQTTTWGKGQLARFRAPDGGLYGLPEDAASDVYLYRQDILDELGLAYPDPNWTAAEALTLWEQCSKDVNGKWRYGTNCPFGPGTTEGLPTVVAGYGGAFMDATQTRCLLDQPGAIAAGDYWFHMVWNKVATNGDGSPNTAIATGGLVFNTSADPTVYYAVTQMQGAKWDFIPWPTFPTRPAGKLHDNFYGMLSSVENKDLAWEVLKFIAVDKQWYEFYMQLSLAPPGRADMMDQWYTVLRNTAPVLKNKHLEYWGDPTLNGYGIYDNEYFLYQPTQANNILNSIWPQIWNHQIGVTQGFRSIAQQITAFEAVAEATAKENAALSSATQVPATGSYPAPSAKGLVGQPATAAPNLVATSAAGITLRGTGAGLGVQGGNADAGTFAAAAETAATATYVCQVSALSRGTCPYLSQWAAAGLMVRGFLTNDAPMVFIGITAGNGVVVATRPSPETPVQVQLGTAGLPTAAQLTKAGAATTSGNVLNAPLWVRIQRSQTTWTLSTSTDGQTWTPAGKPVQVVMPGVWVGPFATANNISFGDKGQAVSAAFTGLQGMKPDQFVQVGLP